MDETYTKRQTCQNPLDRKTQSKQNKMMAITAMKTIIPIGFLPAGFSSFFGIVTFSP